MRVKTTPVPAAWSRIGAGIDGWLAGYVAREPVLGNGVEQPALVAEEPVDGGRLHASGERHRAGGHRVRPLGGQQLRGHLHELGASAVARRLWILLSHVIDDNRYLLSNTFP